MFGYYAKCLCIAIDLAKYSLSLVICCQNRGNVLATESRISKVNRLHQIICIPQLTKLSRIV